ncbi:MAG: acyl-CoA reductase [Bacteroidetes bacterium]|nr:MAG: acyl-CoA reductase [Bacteroidota bacterium]
MNLEKRISALSRLGEALKVAAEVLERGELGFSESESAVIDVQRQSTVMNPWFSKENIVFSFQAWSKLLTRDKLEMWISVYDKKKLEIGGSKQVAVINAGNIPLVGFHDFLTILLSGNSYVAKNASDDKLLLPYVASLLISIEPEFISYITFTERLKEFDAVIATGSNNSSRYFNYYFGKYPHIIRNNRNGVAVLDGSESEAFFKSLADDIFIYFGLGCRNVSKLFVPVGYNFDLFFRSVYDRNLVMQHNKYMNNFEHHNAILLLKQIPFLQNGFLILLENPAIPSPVAVLNYEYYSDEGQLFNTLIEQKENIQCIVSSNEKIQATDKLKSIVIKEGKTQEPGLANYADGIDTMEFLLSL